jgi:hypothetical protein
MISFLGSSQNYPHLQGLQPDLYRCFMERMWQNSTTLGAIGMIHFETHFTDEKAGLLRSELYRRLRRHWHFVNELLLFEIEHHKHFGVTIHGVRRTSPSFTQACWLYHPDTAARSLDHDGSGPEPGLKDPDGKWDLRPHGSRITTVDLETLRTWHQVLESPDVPALQTRMVYAVNRSTAAVLDKSTNAKRISDLQLQFSRGWDESRDRRRGRFVVRWGVPESWDDVILQGPHIYVATPIYKSPNRTMLNNLDWSATDFETRTPDAIPATVYKPAGDRGQYDDDYGVWGKEEPHPVRQFYRVAWRNMAANTGGRTLMPALIPPGAAHIHTVSALGSPSIDVSNLVLASAFMASLISDFAVRTAPKSTISGTTVGRLPYADTALSGELLMRALRLNCVTAAYADLWHECYSEAFLRDAWAGGLEHNRRRPIGELTPTWTEETPLRIAADRRQAQVELDTIVAISLGLTADELCTIYRTQFAVLYGYDRTRDFYDANGRLVPNEVMTAWRVKADRLAKEERTATNQAGNTYTYELPFVTLDREADMRQAYAHFERLLRERS